MSASIFDAPKGDIASTVIMPGDPLRAKYIAESFLDDAVQVSSVRNMLGFTGTRNGHRLSVIAHGIGIASAMVYTTELIREYGAEIIVRVGSCGTIAESSLRLRDLMIAVGASTDSNVNRQRFDGMDLAALADYGLLDKIVQAAEKSGTRYQVGNVFSSDYFYPPDGVDVWQVLRRCHISAVEMEIAGIYGVAAEYGIKAVAMCTVSDEIMTGKQLSIADRESSFDSMIRIALDALTGQ